MSTKVSLFVAIAAAFAGSLLAVPSLAPSAGAQGAPTAITEQEAHAIGVDAYVYFYPLVTMDLTREQLTNVEPGKGGIGSRRIHSPTLRSFRRPT